MPADPTPDLAALDALYQAATDAAAEVDQITLGEGPLSMRDLYKAEARRDGARARLMELLFDAWPALRRRLEIGDAAVEATERLCHWATQATDLLSTVKPLEEPAVVGWVMRETTEAVDAARSRLRALREAQNG